MFMDFPPNVIGSFLIGILTAGSALPALFPQLGAAGAAVVKPLQLLFLPRDWSLQTHAALHIGMRTGYCGSLTTFSSWILQVVVLMVGRTAGGASGAPEGTKWPEALWAIYLGVCGPLIALVAGQQAGMAVAHALHRREAAVAGPTGPAAGGVAAAAVAAGLGVGPAEVLGKVDGVVVAASQPRRQQQQQQQQQPQAQAGSRAVGEATSPEIAAPPAHPGSGSGSSTDGAGCVTVTVHSAPVAEATEPPPQFPPPPTAMTTTTAGNNGSTITLPTGAGAMAAAANAAEPRLPPVAPPPPPPTTTQQQHAPLLPLAHIAADIGSLLMLLTLTGVSAAYAYVDRGPPGDPRRMWWIAILFGPPGAALRWYLSRFNAVPASWRCSVFGNSSRCSSNGGAGAAGDWAWLQLGTFAANLAACLLNFTNEALLFRLGGSLTDLQAVVLQALMTGTAGCLSTVSTWVVELQKLSAASPSGTGGAAYKYGAVSVVTPVALGLLIYGVPAWTAPRP
ncbi:hypothetical protein HYH02_013148 [Chlamydomonas schloesseri]|uniref:Uncharacterized protein n=1 Tax=Chlamydomonas schloesseri TaxID=2026947 RepID=A0A835T155_9CHLO|nr:hypothetical protein HYH02_013148 [Chlamydomonas schloesseri]|eukprot:KAG2431929.1 hypothetical protein HYH02_013148 [Chlamydomonas schloesseri]